MVTSYKRAGIYYLNPRVHYLRNIMALDSFLKDDGYQEVKSSDRNITDRYAPDQESEEEEDYEYGNGRGTRR